MKPRLLTSGVVLFILALITSAPDAATGKLPDRTTSIDVAVWYWEWRQPPYVILIGYLNYPYVVPASELVVWGGENSSILYTETTDIVDDSPYAKGLYRSYDAGLTWENINDGFSDNIIETLVVNPDYPAILLAGTDNRESPGGMYRSIDGGDSWENVIEGRIIYDIEVSPAASNIIYASTCCWGGIFRSDDYGQTWKQISDAALEDLEVHPTQPEVIFGARQLSTTSEEGIYRSDNAGKTWTQIANIGGQHWIIIDDENPDRMYAFGRSYGGIWRTENGGQDWVDLSSGLPYVVTEPTVMSAALDFQEDLLWIGLKYGGILVSGDHGNSWAEVNTGLPFVGAGIFGPQCTSIAISPHHNRLAISCSGRLFVNNIHQLMFLPLIVR